MSRVAEVGDNLNFTADGTVGFDNEGYVLEPGADGDRHVAKSTPGSANSFVGVNHKSTYNYDGSEVLTGQPVGVVQDGVALVLAKEGVDYGMGTTLYTPAAGDDAGVATDSDDPAGDGTVDPVEVGKVVEGYDASGDASPVLLKVRVDGRV